MSSTANNTDASSSGPNDSQDDSFGAAAIKQMIEASEASSATWSEFYRKLQVLTSSAVEYMPPHHIKVVRSSDGYLVSIHGPVYNYDHNGSKVWSDHQ